jgi:hypothetical protein
VLPSGRTLTPQVSLPRAPLQYKLQTWYNQCFCLWRIFPHCGEKINKSPANCMYEASFFKFLNEKNSPYFEGGEKKRKIRSRHIYLDTEFVKVARTKQLHPNFCLLKFHDFVNNSQEGCNSVPTGYDFTDNSNLRDLYKLVFAFWEKLVFRSTRFVAGIIVFLGADWWSGIVFTIV